MEEVISNLAKKKKKNESRIKDRMNKIYYVIH